MSAIQASDDPMIKLALAMQDDTRAVRSDWEARVQAPTDRASERLAAARFAGLWRHRLSGCDRHPAPDLWPDRGHRRARTAVRGLHDLRRTVGPGDRLGPVRCRAETSGRAGPDRRETVLNMAVSSDTIGGSSGSPVVTPAFEIVGANFDSTVLSQRNAYGYDRNVNRIGHRDHRCRDRGAARRLRDGAAGRGAGRRVTLFPPSAREGG